jgi:hypothetical protein
MDCNENISFFFFGEGSKMLLGLPMGKEESDQELENPLVCFLKVGLKRHGQCLCTASDGRENGRIVTSITTLSLLEKRIFLCFSRTFPSREIVLYMANRRGQKQTPWIFPIFPPVFSICRESKKYVAGLNFVCSSMREYSQENFIQMDICFSIQIIIILIQT